MDFLDLETSTSTQLVVSPKSNLFQFRTLKAIPVFLRELTTVTSDFHLPNNQITPRTLLLELLRILLLALVLSSSEMEYPHPVWSLCTPSMDKTHGTFSRMTSLTIFLLLKILDLSFLPRNSQLQLLSSNTLVFLIFPSMAKMVKK